MVNPAPEGGGDADTREMRRMCFIFLLSMRTIHLLCMMAPQFTARDYMVHRTCACSWMIVSVQHCAAPLAMYWGLLPAQLAEAGSIALWRIARLPF